MRIGACAITTRGADANAMKEIVTMIDHCLRHHTDDNEMQKLQKQVADFCRRYPIY